MSHCESRPAASNSEISVITIDDDLDTPTPDNELLKSEGIVIDESFEQFVSKLDTQQIKEREEEEEERQEVEEGRREVEEELDAAQDTDSTDQSEELHFQKHCENFFKRMALLHNKRKAKESRERLVMKIKKSEPTMKKEKKKKIKKRGSITRALLTTTVPKVSEPSTGDDIAMRDLPEQIEKNNRGSITSKETPLIELFDSQTD